MIVIPSTTDVRSVDITMCRANWLDDDPLLAHLDEPVPDPATRAWIAALSDASARRREFAFCPPACLRPALRNMLADTRDEPLLYLLVNVLLTTVPAAVAVFWLCAKVSTPWGHCLGAVYLAANYVTFLQRFLLGLHCSAHRPLFRSAYSSLNGVMPYMIAPLFGIPAGMYQLHHCIMHHVVSTPSPEPISYSYIPVGLPVFHTCMLSPSASARAHQDKAASSLYSIPPCNCSAPQFAGCESNPSSLRNEVAKGGGAGVAGRQCGAQRPLIHGEVPAR